MQILLNLPFLIAGFAVKTVFFMKKGFWKTYLKGLCKGVSLCFSEEGREHKVRFSSERFYNYAMIQFELWRNLWHLF